MASAAEYPNSIKDNGDYYLHNPKQSRIIHSSSAVDMASAAEYPNSIKDSGDYYLHNNTTHTFTTNSSGHTSFIRTG
jgi:hypothetical protein